MFEVINQSSWGGRLVLRTRASQKTNEASNLWLFVEIAAQQRRTNRRFR